MDCREVKDLLSEYMDAALAENRQADVRQHLSRCEGCAGEAAGIRAAWTLLERAPEMDPPSGFRERVFARIAESQPTASPKDRSPGAWRRIWIPVGSIAGVILAVALWLFSPGGGRQPSLSERQQEEVELVANLDLLEQKDLLADLEVLENFDLLMNLEEMPAAGGEEG